MGVAVELRTFGTILAVILAGVPGPGQAGDAFPPYSRDPVLKSVHPLYFRLAFGKPDGPSVLGVIDESGNTGTGYNLVYVDENRDGDLGNDGVKTFPERKTKRPDYGPYEPEFTVKGVVDGKAMSFTLNISSLGYAKAPRPFTGPQWFTWQAGKDDWRYLFISGQVVLYATAEQARVGKPLCLWSPCQWEINARTQGTNVSVSAALKDVNGCRLRLAQSKEPNVPTLTLLKDGNPVLTKKLEFG